jgi:hypothetical protein
MLDSLSVFVNSSDGFRDCWQPFFDLYSRYGGTLLQAPLYLNTEKAEYTYPGINIIPTRVWPDSEAVRPSWSECLLRGLNTVQTPYMLYMQEDYFLRSPLSTAVLAKALDILHNDSSVGVIYLNKFGPQFLHARPFADGFVEILRPARYLVSMQAAIWRKDFLGSLVCAWENGWMFEKFGSLRVRKSNYKLLSVAPQIMNSSPVIDYVYTGVIKGQWKSECIELFEQHEIKVDFSKRGFYREMGRLKSRVEVLRKLVASPSSAVRSLLTVFGR